MAKKIEGETMSLTSMRFIVFVLISLFIYLLCSEQLKKYVLIVTGLLFYAGFNYYGLFYMIFLTLVSYYLSKNLTKIKLYLMIFLIVIVFIFFKLNTLYQIMGISFISFKIISYLTDVYRGMIAEDKLLDYFVYTSFFPLISAGPIVRYNDFKINKEFNYDFIKQGFILFLLGIFEKLVIVLRINEIVNNIYQNPNLNSVYYLLAIFLYSIQIYLDFDAYSNMAIGISRMFGYDIKANFKTPYLSRNIQEFWRRWHISLSFWFKDYVYIPLGGNKKGTFIKYLNILTVSILSGLWHGLSLTCLIWGLLHGFMQIINHMKKMSGFIGWLITFIFVSFSWVFFKSKNLSEAVFIIGKILLFDFRGFNISLININILDFNVTMLFVLTACILDYFRSKTDLLVKLNNCNVIIRWGVYLVLIFCFLLFGKYGINYEAGDFIYQTF